MKKNIHPNYYSIIIICSSCNNRMKFSSTWKLNFKVDICYKCHPFYTRKNRILDSAGRVEKFNKKFKI